MKHEIKLYPTLEETIENDWIVKLGKTNLEFGKWGITINQRINNLDTLKKRIEDIKKTFHNKNF
jgi:archaellum component FlaC